MLLTKIAKELEKVGLSEDSANYIIENLNHKSIHESDIAEIKRRLEKLERQLEKLEESNNELKTSVVEIKTSIHWIKAIGFIVIALLVKLVFFP